jgi:hypothetical protein
MKVDKKLNIEALHITMPADQFGVIQAYKNALYGLSYLTKLRGTEGGHVAVYLQEWLTKAIDEGKRDGLEAGKSWAGQDIEMKTPNQSRCIIDLPVDEKAIEKDIVERMEKPNGLCEVYSSYFGYVIGMEIGYPTGYNEVLPLQPGEEDTFIKTVNVMIATVSGNRE